MYCERDMRREEVVVGVVIRGREKETFTTRMGGVDGYDQSKISDFLL
jgi:hypothetical protein